MPKSKLIKQVAEREQMPEQQADFLEDLILAVRKDINEQHGGSKHNQKVEQVIVSMLGEYVSK